MILRILFLYSFILLAGCASVVSPDGGKKDEKPPVITKTIPDSAAINFNGKEIIFEFDEYFTLANAQQNWVISPSPEKFPEIKKTNNQLKIKLLDSLKPNTTYTFNTANSIADLNEGNVLKNYRFVFSTGNFIDSLQLSGKIINAYTNQPQEEISVLLFDTSQNIYSGTPKYLTKTDKEGNYTFYNLPPALFTICAWNDKNKNKKPEADEDISIPYNLDLTTNTKATIQLVSGVYRKQGIKRHFQPYPGVFSFVTEKPIYLDTLSVSFNNFTLNKRNTHTTAVAPTQDTIEITIPYEKDIDTVSFTVATLDTSYLFKTAVTKYNDTFKVKYIKTDINFGQPLHIEFNLPISSVGILKIINKEEANPLISNISINKNAIDINARLPEGSYKIVLPENYIKSIFNNSYFKEDTLNFNVVNNTSIGSLHFLINDSNNRNLIIELVSDYKTIQSIQCNACSSLVFRDINPGTYQLKIIYDDNNNQIWDIGDITKSLKPEKTILLLNQYKVKSNWHQKDIQLVIPN